MKIQNPAMTRALNAFEIAGFSDEQIVVAARHLGEIYLQGVEDGKAESLPTV